MGGMAARVNPDDDPTSPARGLVNATAPDNASTDVVRRDVHSTPAVPAPRDAFGQMDAETRATIEAFLDETREALLASEPLLMQLEEDMPLPVFDEALQTVFRTFHSMKGTAAFLDFRSIESVTHSAEDLLQSARDGHLPVTPAVVDALCRAQDFVVDRLHGVETTGRDAGAEDRARELSQTLRSLLPPDEVTQASRGHESVTARVGSGERPPLPPALFDRFRVESLELLADCENALLTLGAEEHYTGTLARAWDAMHTFSGHCGDAGFPEMEGLSLAVETLLEELVSAEYLPLDAVITPALGALDLLRAEVESFPAPPRRTGLSVATARIQTARRQGLLETQATRIGALLLKSGAVDAEELAAALQHTKRNPGTRIGQALVDIGAVEREVVERLLPTQATLRADRSVVATPAPRTGHKTLRVDIDKLDELSDLVGEIMVISSVLAHNPAVASLSGTYLATSTEQLSRASHDLHEVAMSLRRVPISGAFRRMVRLVRDVARRQDKRVQLLIDGETNEVDKGVAEVIADPLVHLLRNAVDHGIEPPQERQAAGKSREGVIHLEASHRPGELWVVVRDDGRGLDVETLYDQASERGLTTAARDELDDAYIQRFIFETGFSTAAHVSDISGRGMGLDVVKRNIESIGGHIDIHSVPGLGTTITLRIPLSQDVMEGMLLRVGSAHFTLPVLRAHASVVMEKPSIARLPNGQEMARVHGERLPVVRLHEIYAIEADSIRIEDGVVLVLQEGGTRFCLFVDEVIGHRQNVTRGFSSSGGVQGLSGVTVLDDRHVSFILDVASLLQWAQAA